MNGKALLSGREIPEVEKEWELGLRNLLLRNWDWGRGRHWTLRARMGEKGMANWALRKIVKGNSGESTPLPASQVVLAHSKCSSLPRLRRDWTIWKRPLNLNSASHLHSLGAWGSLFSHSTPSSRIGKKSPGSLTISLSDIPGEALSFIFFHWSK